MNFILSDFTIMLLLIISGRRQYVPFPDADESEDFDANFARSKRTPNAQNNPRKEALPDFIFITAAQPAD